jgi:hypothetical protein
VVGQHGRVVKTSRCAAHAVHIRTALRVYRIAETIDVLAGIGGEYL